MNDAERVALWIIPPKYSHVREDDGSPAMDHARTILESRGSQPRINRNMLVFAAADAGRLTELVEAIARWKAWQSIVKEIGDRSTSMSGVTQGQEESARSDLASASNRVLGLVPETYQWMLLPSQSAPGEPVRTEEYKVTGSEAIAERCAKLLRKRDRLMPVMDGIALRLELDNIPLWNGDDIAVDTLCTYFARYVYLPRVGSRETILEAIRNGVAQPVWNPQTFAWASGKTEMGYTEIVAGEPLLSHDVAAGYIVKPEVAQAQIDAAAAARATQDRMGAQGDADTPGCVPRGAQPGAEGTQGGNHTGGGTSQSQPPTPLPDGTSPPSQPPSSAGAKRYFGTVELNPLRASTQMGQVHEEVISHLIAAGAKVSISIDILCPKCGWEDEVQFRACETAGSSAWPNCSDLRSSKIRLRYAISSLAW